MLQVYNSASKSKQIFEPITKKQVNLYVCGMTVYDYCHVGHGRVMVNFDMMVRYFRFRGYQVKYVRNITDIDDKIIVRAIENDEPFHELTDRFIQAMHDDEKLLGVLPPDEEPRATDYMPQMIAMIETLIEKEYAYVAENGDVYYDVTKFADYGCLAHKDLDDLQAGARVAITEEKHNPLDFVLWKMAKPNEPNWDSPWGPGRPGWHIECSAMATTCLSNHFDIHGGGFDLKFPHHENEIAQSEAATNEKFVNYWMHVGFVQVNKEKMSKSLGNFFTIREILDKYDAETVRYFLLSSHYRSPVNFSQESLEIAHTALERFYTSLRDIPVAEEASSDTETDHEKHFIAAMDDDFNTPEAIAVLFDITHDINRLRNENPSEASEKAALLRRLAGVLGLLTQQPEAFLQAGQAGDQIDAAMREKIEALIAEREVARTNKEWAKADQGREQLTALGVTLEDVAGGTTKWRIG